ncbi:hypothetical protein Anapl_08577 [Anas platyrhynchos]|uniref:Uncharacterized protein n=1 Tax=Anas platyrhynchos TaxID=8839 RepID=R0K8L6_ANAPL|nr:hypothetical protein Anapl_08577 [Anas platyrhynchos]
MEKNVKECIPWGVMQYTDDVSNKAAVLCGLLVDPAEQQCLVCHGELCISVPPQECLGQLLRKDPALTLQAAEEAGYVLLTVSTSFLVSDLLFSKPSTISSAEKLMAPLSDPASTNCWVTQNRRPATAEDQDKRWKQKIVTKHSWLISVFNFLQRLAWKKPPSAHGRAEKGGLLSCAWMSVTLLPKRMSLISAGAASRRAQASHGTARACAHCIPQQPPICAAKNVEEKNDNSCGKNYQEQEHREALQLVVARTRTQRSTPACLCTIPRVPHL